MNWRRSLKLNHAWSQTKYSQARQKETLAIHAAFWISGLNISEVLGKSIETFKVQPFFRDHIWFFWPLSLKSEIDFP